MPTHELEPFLRKLARDAEGFLRDQRGCFDREEYEDCVATDEEWEEHVETERRVIDHNLDVLGAC